MSGISRPKLRIALNNAGMDEKYHIGDRIKIFLDSKYWKSEGWFEGTVKRIDPYSDHRSFYWVELDEAIQDTKGNRTKLISVFNLKNVKRTS
jgi:hypothetical protein